jgi:hypothetical protein
VTALENHVETSIEMSDGNQNFSVTCLTTLNAQTPNVTNGAELVPLGCTLAAKRKCQGMNFAVGVFVGEVTATGGRTANCLN